MNVALRELLAWTAAHHSVITDQVLRSLGISTKQRKRLVAAGLLERIVDGSYRLGGGTTTEAARCVAVCARTIGLVVCGPTAGRLWGLRRMPDDRLIHVIAPPASQPSLYEWLRPYRTSRISPSDIVITDEGIRLTSPPRTALDLSRHICAADLRSVIDQLIADGRCTAATMRRTAEFVATPGRPWARRFIAELDKLPGGRAPESHGESRVVAALIERGVTGLVTQHWLEVPPIGRIRLDAAVPSIRWGVEIDGHPDHFTESGSSKDHRRDLACDAIGWKISRVTGQMVRDDFTSSLELLINAYWRRMFEIVGRRPAA